MGMDDFVAFVQIGQGDEMIGLSDWHAIGDEGWIGIGPAAAAADSRD